MEAFVIIISLAIFFYYLEKRKERKKRLELAEKRRKECLEFNVDADELNQLHCFLSICESEPEKILLKELIRQAKLKPLDNKLIGEFILIPQVPLGRYRVDFLINNYLVVEVDGYQHDKPSAKKYDFERNQTLSSKGYMIIRYKASDIYDNKSQIAKEIISNVYY